LKLKIGQYFAADAWLRLCSLILVENLKLGFVKILKFESSQKADVWLKLVEVMKLRLGRDSEDEILSDLCLNLGYDLSLERSLLWKAELNPRVCCAFGNV